MGSPLPLPPGVSEFYVASHDLNYHVLSAGQKGQPLILCLHGFPELAFAWRMIMPVIANEGYYVVAYDQRGYGRTTGWDTRDYSAVDLNTFTYTSLVRDSVVLVNALGYKEVECIIGHDVGAVIAPLCALIRPDMFKAVIAMSVPLKPAPSVPFNILSDPQPATVKKDIHKALAELPEPRKHYRWYNATQAAGAEFDGPDVDRRDFLRGYFHTKSADWRGNEPRPLKAWEAEELAQMPYYYIMPLHSGVHEAVQISMLHEDPVAVSKSQTRWMSDQELGVYVHEFARTGFQGGLNWFRIFTDPARAKELELFAGRRIDGPSLFIAGEKDWGIFQEPGAFENMKAAGDRFYGAKIVEGAGHWVQQEQPGKVSQLVIDFLHQIKSI